jgi:hypothetical protein
LGRLTYGAATEVVFEDRVLAHLQLVISAKLKRQESFLFSWYDDTSSTEGRTVLWMESSIPLVFRYDSRQMPTVNREWLERLTDSANSSRGLTLDAEPQPSV